MKEEKYMSKVSIIQKNNFLEDNFCDFFVDYISNSKNKTTHRDTNIIYCDRTAVLDEIIEFKVLLAKLTFFVKKYSVGTCINYSQIVEWPENSLQPSHLDFNYHTYTSILYLNDDYEGGETLVGTKVIRPKKGKIVLFKGNKIKHQVLKIKSGKRYTNPTWYITPTRKGKINVN
jgi:hypothetical protein|tara:strand:+ start:453 stop:974 length:522 start_codon:yes stop_codon:yes gene_type:complete